VTNILLRARKDPFEVVSAEDTLIRNMIADNSGNSIFFAAAQKILSTRDTTVTADRLLIDPGDADEINERYDAYVIPLANAFRHSYQPILDRMTELIRRLRIPVVILGVGAQSNVDYETDRLRPLERSVRAFVSAVLDRAPSIGVRGEFTHDYLTRLGFRDVEVIGCPSMFFHGDHLPIEKRSPALGPDALLAMNVSPYVKRMGPIVLSHHARYPNLVYVAQDLGTLELLLWGESERAATRTDPMPIHTTHPLFLENKIRFYVDPWPWIDALRGADFAFGTRIHGNIAALLAGTPCYVLAHDSRTLELARYFEIPHRRMRDVPPDTDAAALYAEADYTGLVRGHPARFAAFADYLARNGLHHIFSAGEDPLAFDRRIAETDYPAAVDASGDRQVRTVVRRLRRLDFRVRRSGRIRWNRATDSLRSHLGNVSAGQVSSEDDPAS
jgi:polysaccharide pyruvyl transferase